MRLISAANFVPSGVKIKLICRRSIKFGSLRSNPRAYRCSTDLQTSDLEMPRSRATPGGGGDCRPAIKDEKDVPFAFGQTHPVHGRAMFAVILLFRTRWDGKKQIGKFTKQRIHLDTFLHYNSFNDELFHNLFYSFFTDSSSRFVKKRNSIFFLKCLQFLASRAIIILAVLET